MFYILKNMMCYTEVGKFLHNTHPDTEKSIFVDYLAIGYGQPALIGMGTLYVLLLHAIFHQMLRRLLVKRSLEASLHSSTKLAALCLSWMKSSFWSKTSTTTAKALPQSSSLELVALLAEMERLGYTLDYQFLPG